MRKSATKTRTGITKGDIIYIEFGRPNKQILLSVTRENRFLLFEGKDESRKSISADESTAEEAENLIAFICQITGLQANLIDKCEDRATYEMIEGEQLIIE